ncbi:hypothetical protein [Thioclava sp.]|uniref:hypothetical protein n=1 Tax=Thioclava sp. TaxID=1933450 RepID=UPI003AA92E94
MSAKRFTFKSTFVILLAVAALVGPLAPLTAVSAHAEKAVAPEKNPPGDIPDTQVFIPYQSAGYSLQVPEGWARSGTGPTVRFVGKLDAVAITISKAPAKLDLAWVKDSYLPVLEKTGRAVKLGKTSTVTLPFGQALRIDYSDNSEPNVVTGKQVRLEHNLYLFEQGGKMAALNLSAPYGADNVDQWRLMSRSFGWK